MNTSALESESPRLSLRAAMLGELLNPSETHSFTQKIFTEAYYVTGTAPDAGDMTVNKRDNNPHPHRADILEELRGRDRQ